MGSTINDNFGYRMHGSTWHEDGLVAAYGFRGIYKGNGKYDGVATNYSMEWDNQYHLKALSGMLNHKSECLLDMFDHDLRSFCDRNGEFEERKHYELWGDAALTADFKVAGGYIHVRIGIRKPCDLTKSVSQNLYESLDGPDDLFISYLKHYPEVGSRVSCKTSGGWVEGTVLTYIHAHDMWTYGIVLPDDLSSRDSEGPWTLLANFMNNSEIKTKPMPEEKPKKTYQITVDFKTKVTFLIDEDKVPTYGLTREQVTEQVVDMIRHKDIWIPSSDGIGATLRKDYMDRNGIQVLRIQVDDNPISEDTFRKPIWGVMLTESGEEDLDD